MCKCAGSTLNKWDRGLWSELRSVRAVLRAMVGRAAVRAVRERLGRPPLAFPVVTDALGLCSESVRCREYVGLVCGAVPGDCGGVQRVAF